MCNSGEDDPRQRYLTHTPQRGPHNGITRWSTHIGVPEISVPQRATWHPTVHHEQNYLHTIK